MKSIVKKTTAYFLIFMLIFGMSMSSFAITNPYLTLGNDKGAETVFSYYDSGLVFKSMVGKLYATFENGSLTVTNAPDLAAKISVTDNGNQATWSSQFPIDYLFVKSGDIKDLVPKELVTNKLAGNAGGLLYEYPANTKSGDVTTPDGIKAISHLVFFFDRPVPTGKIIVTKDVNGDVPKTPGLFKFNLIKVGTPDTVYASFNITGENSFTLENVPYGTYKLQEYDIPVGYVPETNPIEIIVNQDVTPYAVTFDNTFTEEKISVGVTKAITGDKYPTDQIFKFELVNKSTGLVVKTLSITGTGTAYFDPVPLGTYFVREVDIPSGFELTTPNNVEIVLTSGSQPNPITFSNNYDPYKYKINVNKTLSGVPFFSAMTFTFELYRDVAEGPDVLVDTITIIGEDIGTFKLVEEGSYYVKEKGLDSPLYYLTGPNDVPVTVGSNNPEATVNFNNHHITYLLGVHKVLSRDSDTPTTVQEFTFNLYRQSEPNIVIDTVKIPVGGHGVFKPLEAGTYIVREVPVDGYELIPGGDRIVTFPMPAPAILPAELTAFTSETIIITPEVDEELTFINKYTRLYDISVIKDIEGLPQGAPSSVFTFALFNAFAPTVEIDRITIIGEDVGHFDPVPAGNYIIREINLPTGYEQEPFETEIQDVTTLDGAVSVGPEQTAARKQFINNYIRMFDIKVNKTLTGGSQNAEFTFRLFEVGNPEYLQEIKISGTGSNYFDPVPAGEYYVKEVNLPGGYVLRTANDQPAVVHVEKPEAEVSFRNDYVEESTEPTTAPPTTEPTTAPPTTEPTSAPTTENLTDEFIPEGFNFDLIFDEPEEITEEETPLGTALPQTGQLPAGLFYGFGGLISSLGIFLKKRK